MMMYPQTDIQLFDQLCNFPPETLHHPGRGYHHCNNNNNINNNNNNNNNNNLPFNMHYSTFNHQDFPYMHCEQTNLEKKWMKKRKFRPEVPEEIVKQRQLRRNERERARQNRLNDAFDVLRNTIPEFLTPFKRGGKLTQIETLRLARHYISSLKNVLDDKEDEDDVINVKQEIWPHISANKNKRCWGVHFNCIRIIPTSQIYDVKLGFQ